MGGKSKQNMPFKQAKKQGDLTMKMVKKIFMGLAALAMVAGLVGCIPNDDTENIITGNNGHCKVDYTYETEDGTATYRAYKSTILSHAGALVKITINKNEESGNSKMGVIFGLKERTENKKKLRDFNIIGIGSGTSANYYVSTLKNIENLQAENFGATPDAAEGPTEQEWVKLANGKITYPSTAVAEDGTITVYIWYQATKEGSYKWAILDMTEDQATAWKNLKAEKAAGDIPTATKILASGTITDAFDAVESDDKIKKGKISFYAMVKGTKTLTGSWDVVGTYLEAEDAE